NIESLNDNPTPDLVLNSFVSFPISEESDNSLSDNISPEFETFCDHTKETRSEGDIRFLEALLSDDSIPFPNNESSESNFDNPSGPLPPPEPPDAEFHFELDTGEVISVVMNDRDEFDVSNDENDDYFPFMFVIQIFLPYLICSKMFLSFLFAESEDTIFDPA
nr:hypothetical protein [Tanacetum cinerariifolium]